MFSGEFPHFLYFLPWKGTLQNVFDRRICDRLQNPIVIISIGYNSFCLIFTGCQHAPVMHRVLILIMAIWGAEGCSNSESCPTQAPNSTSRDYCYSARIRSTVLQGLPFGGVPTVLALDFMCFLVSQMEFLVTTAFVFAPVQALQFLCFCYNHQNWDTLLMFLVMNKKYSTISASATCYALF